MSKAGDINIRKQATISFAGTLADTGISFLGLIAMAYILGASGLGQYYLILSVVGVALFPINGLGQAVLKRGSEKDHDADEVYGTGLTMALLYALTVTVGVLGIVTTNLVSIRFDFNIVLVAATVFISRTILNTQIDAYRGYGHTGHATLVDNVYGILQTILQLGVLALGFRVFGLLAATTAATVATVLGHYLVSVVSVSRPRFSVARSLLKYGRWSVVSSGVSTVYQRLPVLVLGFVGMDAAIGYYTSANRLLILGSHVGGSLAPAVMAKTSSVTSETMFEEFRNAHHHVSILAVALAFGSFALSDALMETFFDMSDPLAASALIGLAFYHILRTLTRIEFAFLDGLDMPELGTRSIAVSLAVQAVSIPVLFFEYGFLGVVGAIVLAHFVMLTVGQVIFWTKFGTVPLPGGLLTQAVSGSLMFIVVEALAKVLGIPTVFHLLGIVGVGAAVYMGMLFVVDSGFREVVQSTLTDTKQTLSG
ncbi:oligosaccharide flippase family protein [Halopenitus persicus]|uniref:Membrane protein involved in the export of O-antigen and teichoic acid n=1 Tax=Halopenitus persicus TaxID=1048396 RepID=A0A1H3MCK4_9EURY|nr:oligosaccharide flippase family protein [Halopenitus persicus]SDY74427.1 Membrane protein involved in the export of O-antigen and teichoic acid [Halopenitus persicus]